MREVFKRLIKDFNLQRYKKYKTKRVLSFG
jgi:hypothetical protein